jgi:LysM repeat protein
MATEMHLRGFIKLALQCVLALAVVAVSLGPPTAWAQDQVVHVVQAGESVYSIALRYGTTVQAIVDANALADPDTIQIGQRLVMPADADPLGIIAPAMTTGGTYVVQRGDTLSAIAFRYGVSLWELMLANGLYGSHLIYVGHTLVIPGAGGTIPESLPDMIDTYIVRPGDTLSSIAERFNTTAFALAQSNGLSDPTLIREGQVLRVPQVAQGPVTTVDGQKHIEIDLSEQHLYASNGDELVYSFICSSGRAPYGTKTGDFQVQSKIANAYGGLWGIWMPNWLGIYWAGGSENGIHGLPVSQSGQTLWAGYLGTPISFGCIVLGSYEAELLYNWADIGTRVTIHR